MHETKTKKQSFHFITNP